MADALSDLLKVYMDKLDGAPPDSVAVREMKIMLAYKGKAIRDATVTSLVGGGLVWMAARGLDKYSRTALAGGAGYKCWKWGLLRSVDSLLEHILAWDGSQMQHELSKIMLQKYKNDPKKEKLFTKYFYRESVFDDSSDLPIPVYRQRNLYVDQAVALQNSYAYLPGAIDNVNYPTLKNDHPESSGGRRINLENLHVQVDHKLSIFMDPLDYLLGYSDSSVAADHPESAPTTAKAPSRPHRRLHHRSRRHQQQQHHKDSD